ncbi:MAG TPA: SLC13 family permease [Candidatus Saccharimonadia bacterium]|nr:SLC13 family permease [Candidatus Saccharimonadia bacterium]
MDEGAGATGGRWALAAGPLLALLAGFTALGAGLAPAVAITLAVTVWCATWWVLEPVAGAVTALVPLALLPAAGVLTPKQVAESYGNELILLFAGGFMLSTAMERSGAHRRLALAMVRAFGGTDGRRIVYGFAAATGFISMWMSNTATTLMMLPVALAILEAYPDKRLAAPLVLAIAYAASIGGLGTPIGTAPNLVFMQVYEQTTGTRMGFLEWMRFGIPVVAIFLPLSAWWLARGLHDSPPAVLPEPGAWQPAERRVLAVFALVALAWITRIEPLDGWTGALGLPGVNDASIALAGVVLLCTLPDGRGGRLLTWEAAERIPWGALVLFGGGIAIATAFQVSGLSEVVATQLAGLRDVPVLLLMFVIAASVTLISEMASNTATAVLLMPIMAATGVAVGVDPALFMVPAVLAASCGFMLPVATAPNLIAYGTGFVDNRRMLREGAVLDAMGVAIVALVCYIVIG